MATKKRKDPAAVELGRRGGKKGGKAKVPKGFAMASEEEIKEKARAGAAKKWANYYAAQAKKKNP